MKNPIWQKSIILILAVLAGIVSAAAPTGIQYSVDPALYDLNGTGYANTPTVSGGVPTSWSVDPALPSGLSLNGSTGEITGVPTASFGPASYVITASNADGSTSATLRMRAASLELGIITYFESPVTYSVGTPIQVNVPYTATRVSSYSISSALPAGLNFDNTTGKITGTPLVPMVRKAFLVTGDDGESYPVGGVSIAVLDRLPVISYTVPRGLVKGDTVSWIFPVSTGGTVLGYSISPALPAGMSLNSTTGRISGTPTVSSSEKTYTVTATNSGGSSTATFVMGVYEKPSVSASSVDSALVAGTAAVLQVAATANGTLSYQWLRDGVVIPGANGASYAISSASLADTGRYQVAVTSTESGFASTVTVNAQRIYVNIAPVITTQPRDITVTSGFLVLQLVGVDPGAGSSAGDVSYQWKRNGQPLAGETSFEYWYAAGGLDTALYTVEVTRTLVGTTTVTTSNAVRISVFTHPVITAQPRDTTVGAGQSVILSVTATGYGRLSYQWQKDGADITAGGNASTYSIPSAQAADSGSYAVTVTVTDTVRGGSLSTVSRTAKVTVVGPPVLTGLSTSTVVRVGDSVNWTVSVAKSSVTYSYQWTKDGSDLPGYTSNRFVIPSAQISDAGTYRVRVTASASGVSVSTLSDSIVLRINTPPVLVTSPQNTTVRLGATATFSVSASAPGALSYQWFKNGMALSTGGTDSVLTLNSITENDTGEYTVQVTSNLGGTTTTTTSGTARLDIRAKPLFTYFGPLTYRLGDFDFVADPTYEGEADRFSISPELPSGFRFDEDWGTIYGAANELSPAQEYRVIAYGAEGEDTTFVTIEVLETLPSAYYDYPEPFKVGKAIVPMVPNVLVGPVDRFSIEPSLDGTGLVLDTLTGVITGTPIRAMAARDYTVTYYGPTGSNATGFTLVFLAPPAISYASEITTGLGFDVDQSPVSSGGAVNTYTISPPLPAGLTFNSSTGAISGKPTTLAEGNYQIVAEGPGGSDTSIVFIAIYGAPDISGFGQKTYLVGTPIEPLLPSRNGGPVTSYRLIPSLSSQSGLIFDSVTGMLSGTPLQTLAETEFDVIASGPGGSDTIGLTLTVHAAAVITEQPESRLFVVGGTLRLSVKASGSGTLSYQWTKNDQEIPGATSEIYLVDSAAATDSGWYAVRVTSTVEDASGSVWSDSVKVSIHQPPLITQQPQDARQQEEGFELTLSVAASGVGALSYQWFKGDTALPVFTIPDYSQDGAGYSMSPQGTSLYVKGGAEWTGTYKVRVTSYDSVSGTTTSVTSQAARLTFITPVEVAEITGDTTVVEGSAFTMKVRLKEESVMADAQTILRWEKETASGDSLLSYTSDLYSSRYTIDSVTAADAGIYSPYCAIDYGSGETGFNCEPFHLYVNTFPKFTSSARDTMVPPGGSANFSVAATATGSLTYEWKRNGVAIAGANASTYTVSPAMEGDTGTYSVTVTSTLNGVTTQSNHIAGVLKVTLPPEIEYLAPDGTPRFEWQAFQSDSRTISPESSGGPVDRYSIHPDLPAGMHFDTATGILTGVPANYVDQDFTVVASGPGGKDSATFFLVRYVNPIITYPKREWTYVVGQEIDPLVPSVDSDVGMDQFVIDPELPEGSGLTFDAVSGTISGIPRIAFDRTRFKVEGFTYVGASGSDTIYLTLHGQPVVSAGPRDTVLVKGGRANFKVSATAQGSLSFQWKKNGVDVAGATDSTFAIDSVAISDSGSYSVIVLSTLDSTTTSTTSVGATLRVLVPPLFKYTGNFSWTTEENDSRSVTPVSLGGPIDHYSVTPPLPNGMHLDSMTGTISGIPTGYIDGRYSVIATGRDGSGFDTVNINIVRMVLPGIMFADSIRTYVVGVPLQALLPTITEPADGITNFDIIPELPAGSGLTFDATTGGISGTPLQAMDRTRFTVFAYTNFNLGTTPLYLTLHGSPSITSGPHDTTVVNGSLATFRVDVAAQGALSYQWKKDGVDITDATGSTLTLSSVSTSDTGSYSVEVISTLNGTTTSTNSASAKLSVNVAPVIVTQPVDQTVVSGSAASFSVLATGLGTLSYQWKKDGVDITGATSSTLFLSSVSISDTGSYSVLVSSTLNGTTTSTTSASAKLSVNVAPVIATQPVDQTVVSGSAASFSVSATGLGTLSYQWKKGGEDISGATSSTLSLSSVSTSDTGSYSVEVISTLNGTTTSTTSASAKLSVNVAPVIATQPVDQTVVSGSTASFSVAASGLGTLSYQWKKDGVDITGATSSTLSLSSVSISNTGSYSVLVSSTLNGTTTSTTSASAKLSVNVAPVIATQPVDQTVVSGSAASFSVTASGLGALSYQWSKDGVLIPGATTSTLSLSSVSTSDTGSYSVVVTSTLGSTSTTTNSASGKLSVNVAPVIATQPVDQTVVSGSAASFSVTVKGMGTLSYQWKKDGVHITGATSSTLALSSVTPSDTGSYSVVVTSTLNGATTSTTSTFALLKVLVSPQLTFADSVQTFVVGSPIPSFGPTVLSAPQGIDRFTIEPALPYGSGLEFDPSTGEISGTPRDPLDQKRFVVSVVSGGLSGSAPFYLTLHGAPEISSGPGDVAVVKGSAATFRVRASTQGVKTFLWRKEGQEIPGATDSTYSISSVSASDTGSYSVVVISTLNGTIIWTVSNPARLSMNDTPVIATQPVDQFVESGSAASFSVSATGLGTLSYQWSKDGVDISGATSAIYSVSSVSTSDTGSYSVVVTSTLGSTTTAMTSTSAKLSVNVAPVIATQPVDQTVVSGSAASFSVSATGLGSLSYQWSKDEVLIPGATSSTYSLASVSASDTGSYSVVVTSTLGSTTTSTTSTSAKLSVNVAPVIAMQPVDQTVVSGSAASFSVTTSGLGALSYQWSKDGVLIPGATASTYSVSSVSTSDTGSYSVVVTSTLGSTSTATTSTSAKLSVNVAPVISTHPVNQTALSGSAASFSVSATGLGSLSYQWSKDGVLIPGATSSTYSLASVTALDTGSYSVVVTSTLGSTTTSTTSTSAKLSVNVAPVISTHPVNQTAVSGSAASFSVTASGLGALSYQWKKAGVDIAEATNATFTIPAVSIQDVGSYSVTIVSSLNGTFVSSTSNAAILSVNVGPQIATSPRDTTVVSGSMATFAVVAYGPGGATLSYQWKKGGVEIAGANSAILSMPSATISDTGSYSVAVTSTLNGTTTTTTSGSAKLSVNTAPIISTGPVSQTVLSGTTVAFSVTASAPGTLSYQWKKDGTAIAGSTSAIYTVNSAAFSDVGAYSVTVVSNLNGSVASTTSAAANLTLNAAPQISAPPRDTTVTAGIQASFSVLAAAPGVATLSYQWRKDGVDISGATSATYTRTAATLADTGAYSVAVTSNLNGTRVTTVSATALLRVNVAPVILTQPEASQTFVLGGSATFTVAAAAGAGSSAGTLSYQWRKDGVALANSGTVSGVTTSTLTLSALQASDSGSYTVVVTRTLNGTVTATTSATGVLSAPVSLLPDAFVIQVNGREKPYSFLVPAGTSTEKLTLSIVDTWGRTVWSKSVVPSRDKSTELSWNGRTATGRLASAGMYIVRISVRDGGGLTHHVRRSVTLKPR